MEKQNEIWKDIDGYEEFYQISNFGRFKSKDRIIYDKNGIRIRFNKSKIMSPRIGDRYLAAGLNKNRVQKMFLLHRLVANAFIPNPENKNQVNHKNGIKNDNRVENLEWCTSSENNIHAYLTGLNKPHIGRKMSQETKDKMSMAKKGKPAWNKGHKKALK